jgi:hypothetical protein
MLKKIGFMLPGIVLLLALALGCASTTTTSSNEVGIRTGTYSYLGTQSPGDVWNWTIGEGTFMGTNETQAKYYSGTFITFTSGFNKATIRATNDSGVPTDGTGTAYFLEYPNTLLVVKPADDDSVIVCCARAATAPAAGQYNFVNIPWPSWTSASSTFGTVEVSAAGGLFSFNVKSYDLYGNPVGANLESGFSFSNGKLIKAGNPLQIFMTPSGAFLGDNGPGYGGFVGVANQSIGPTAVAGKQYRGVLFSYDVTSHHGLIEAIGAEPHPGKSNALQGFTFSDIDHNIRETEGVTLEFGAQAGNGIIAGSMTHRNGTIDSFNMVASQVGGKYIVFGISTDGHGRPQNFLVVEK